MALYQDAWEGEGKGARGLDLGPADPIDEMDGVLFGEDLDDQIWDLDGGNDPEEDEEESPDCPHCGGSGGGDGFWACGSCRGTGRKGGF
jgi:hypothetical protein